MAKRGILNKGTIISISPTPQNEDLSEAEFEAISDWEVICCPNASPSFAQEAEIVSEFCVSGEEVSAVGAAAGAETEITVFYQADCVGQDILRAAFGGFDAYAIKKEYADGESGQTNSIIYTRVLVTSTGDGGGATNEFVIDTYGLKIAQPPILVKPEALP